jgi:hypothetical protein
MNVYQITIVIERDEDGRYLAVCSVVVEDAG